MNSYVHKSVHSASELQERDLVMPVAHFLSGGKEQLDYAIPIISYNINNNNNNVYFC